MRDQISNIREQLENQLGSKGNSSRRSWGDKLTKRIILALISASFFVSCFEIEELPERPAEEKDTGTETETQTDTGTGDDTETATGTGTDSDTSVCSEKVMCYSNHPNRPKNECDNVVYLRVYDAVGICEAGECKFGNHLEQCGPGGCLNGFCVDDPCQGVVCNAPPSPICADDGQSLTHWNANAECDTETGNCTYETESSPCPCHDENGRCDNDPCTGIGTYCQFPPASYCDGDTLVNFVQRTCESGECQFDDQTINCPGGCDWGRCTVPDAGVD